MDELDYKIIKNLKKDSRISNTELASKLKVSEGTVRKRIQSLLESKTIQSFTIRLSTKDSFIALVLLNTATDVSTSKISKTIKKMEGVTRVYETAGNYEIGVHTFSKSPLEFNKLVEKIRSIKGVKDTQSLIILEEF